MVKYVDSGEGPGASDKKKKKLGFKVDRRENFEKMLRKKLGQKDKSGSKKGPTRVKSVVFDESALKDYVLSLHKNKNERRVKAFVDMKRKVKKDSAKVRREQREEARRAYNQYAKIPILPNYTFQLPNGGEAAALEEEERSGSDDDSTEDPLDAVLKPLLRERSLHQSVTLRSSSEHRMPAAMTAQGGKKKKKEEEEEEEEDQNEDEEKGRGSRKKKAALKATSLEAFYSSQDKKKKDKKKKEQVEEAGSPVVTVEVRPLFGSIAPAQADAAATSLGRKKAAAPSRALPSVDFTDLPPVVEQELRRLRQETKGPSRTKAKVHTLKELEKIRKIKRHSRKGHGKKSASGKRKNRKS
eukprot:gene6328-4555_t